MIWRYTFTTGQQAHDFAQGIDIMQLGLTEEEGAHVVISALSPRRLAVALEEHRAENDGDALELPAWVTVEEVRLSSPEVGRRLRDLAGGPSDYGHMLADLLLLTCLDDEDAVAAFDAVGKWYA